MKMVKFPSIEQFGTTMKNLKQHFQYEGRDENGKAVYDYSKPLPMIEFTGTVKLHGSNAGVCWDTETNELWAQSRERILTLESDNMGFAFFISSRQDIFRQLIRRYFELTNQKLPKGIISLFGEWAGPGIQKGVAISQIPEKAFFIFDMKVTENANTEEEIVTWYDHSIEFEQSFGLEPLFQFAKERIYDVNTFSTSKAYIDLKHPEDTTNILIELTEAVEKECPIGKFFGISGIGEGIVWRARLENGDVVRFKVKGEKHSSSKVTKLASVDTEKLNSIKEFVEYAVTENRLNQGIEQVFTQYNIEPSIQKTGDFVKWVSSDVIKEELVTMQESNLEPKEVMGAVSKQASMWFKQFLMKLQ